MAFLLPDSRYLLSDVLVDSNGKEYFSDWVPINLEVKDDEPQFEFSDVELGRHDKIATDIYSNPNLWWILPHFNEIEDPFSELDFSDADDMIKYPTYENGEENRIEYPLQFTTDYLKNTLGFDPLDLSLVDLGFILKGLHVPEYIAGTRFPVPSNSTVHEALNDAQNRSSTLS